MLLEKKKVSCAIEISLFICSSFLLNTIFINSVVVWSGLGICEEQSIPSRDELLDFSTAEGVFG